jgi:uncharacterized membrane protein
MQFVLWIHILAAASWFGGGVATQIGSQVFASEPAASRAGWYRLVLRLGQILSTPAAVVVLITGVLLVTGNEAYGFGSTFVSIGFLAVIVGAGIGMAVYGPRSRDASSALESGDTGGAAAAIGRIRQAGLLELALLAITIASMVWKWGI